MPRIDAIRQIRATENTACRQAFWVQHRPELRKRRSHLVGCIMWRVYCDENAELRRSFLDPFLLSQKRIMSSIKL